MPPKTLTCKATANASQTRPTRRVHQAPDDTPSSQYQSPPLPSSSTLHTPSASIQILCDSAEPDSLPYTILEEMVGTPLQSSAAPTIAISNIVDESAYERFVDNYDDIEWSQLPRYCKTLRTQKHKKSWVFQYGYRVSLLHDTSRIYWVCKYCHTHKSPMNHILEVTKSTSNALTHMGQTARPWVPP